MSTRNNPSSPYEARLDDLGVDRCAPTAADVGLREATDDDVTGFLQRLKANDNAPSRIETAIFPHVDRTLFVKWILHAIHPGIEEKFIELKRERGRQFKTAVRKRIRSGDESPSALAGSERMFDTRRMGLTSTNLWLLLIAHEYVRFRTGKELRPAEWQAILDAAYSVKGEVRDVDGERVARNLRRFAAKHRVLGWKAVEKVEGRRLVITARINGHTFIVK